MKTFAQRLEIRIAALYALFGGLWILLSDQLLAALFTDVLILTKVQTYKGSAYVLVSALVIYFLLRRELNLRRRVERDHSVTEERYRLLFENSRDAVLFSAPDGRVLSANPAACRMFGRTELELMNLGRQGIMDVRDARLEEALKERAKTGSFHGELTFFRRDGTGFPGEVSSTIFKDGDGNERTSTIIRDITERKRVEEKLEYQAFLLENVNDAIFATDRERVITSWNPAAEKMFGWTQEEAIGRFALDLIITEITDEQREQAMKKLTENGQYKTETQITRKDGSKTWVEGVNNPLRGRDGEVLGYISINRDTTERKQAENALRDSEQRFTALFRLNPVPIGFTRVSDYSIVDVNDAWTKLTGYTREEALGKTTTELGLAKPETLNQIRIQLGELGKINQLEIPLYKRSGQERIVLISSEQVKLGDDTYFLNNLQDITERKQAEEKLHASEAKFKAVFDNAPVGISILDPQRKLLESNDMLERIVRIDKAGLAAGAYRNRKYIREDGTEIPDSELASARAIAGQKAIWDVVNGIVLEDGEVIWTQVSAAPLELPGNQVVVITEDITERKRAEQVIIERERQMTALVTSLDDIVFEFDEQGTYLSVWVGDESKLAQPKQQLLGRRIEEVLGEEIGRPFTEAVRRSIAEGNTESLEYPLQVLGGLRWFMARVNPVIDMDGSRRTASMLIRDITDRRQAEQELKRWADIFQNVAFGFVVGSPENNLLGIMNPAFARMHGYTIDELMGTPIPDIFAPEDRAGLAGNIQLVHEKGHHAWEARHIRRDGTLFPVIVDAVAVKDETARVLYRIVSVQDITERKQAELALQESEEFLKESQRLANMGSWQLDLATNKAYWSENCYILYGFAPYEIEPTFDLFKSMVHRDDLYIVLEAFEEIQKNHLPLEREFRIRDRQGRLKWVLTNVTPTGEGGQAVKVTGIQIDITERKRAEQEMVRQVERLSALHSIDIAISGSVDLRTNLGILLDHVLSVMEVDAADILVAHPQSPSLDFMAGRGFRTRRLEQAYVSLGGNLAGRAALQQRTIRHFGKLNPETDERLASLWASEGFVSYIGVPFFAKGQLKGVLEIHHRSRLETDTRWDDFLDTLAGQAAIAIDSSQLFNSLQRSNVELALAYDATIEGWSHALDLRDKETEGHTRRVTSLTVELSHTIGISEAEIVQIRRGALLHDIGKMGVPDHILLKPDKLTEEEWEKMRLHPVFAFELLSPINFLRGALDIPYCHHEKWDGTGYPRGLKGNEIPLSARIFAVVDVWDALTNDRPYRRAWSKEKALSYIQEQSGTHFDPKVVEMFLQALDSNGLEMP